MFYTMHVRIGNEARVGYFIKPFKRPFWISSKVAFLIEEPKPKRKQLVIVRKPREAGDSRDEAWVI